MSYLRVMLFMPWYSPRPYVSTGEVKGLRDNTCFLYSGPAAPLRLVVVCQYLYKFI